jgi:hypothetical protein
MIRTIKLTLLAAFAAALFAAPVSAQTVQHRKATAAYSGETVLPSGKVYLLENNARWEPICARSRLCRTAWSAPSAALT